MRSTICWMALPALFLAVAPVPAQEQTPPAETEAARAKQAEQELYQSIADLRERLAAEHDRLVEMELSVNGELLDPLAVKREMVYLTGGKLVEGKLADFFIEEQMEQSIEEGRDPADFEVAEEKLLSDLEESREKFAQQYPDVDFWDVVRTQTGLTKETFLQQRRQTVLFDRVFFPGPVDDWPLVTREAIRANANQGNEGDMMLEQLEKATSGTDENGNPKQLPEMWVGLLRNFVTKQLREWSDIRYGSHGLDPQYVVAVNDRKWPTKEAWDFVKQGVYVQDLERAMREVVIREALRQELVANDVYLGDEDFIELFTEYRKPYDESFLNIRIIAMRFKGYPCLEAFRARWRLIRSYEEMIADEIVDENLRAHGEEYSSFFNQGKASVEVITFQGRDQQTGAWVPGGMAAARERAEAAFERLEEGEVGFEELRREVGEFYDNDELKGRFGFKPYNQVRQLLRENEFTDLLEGSSVARYLFFEAPVGKAVGPLRGPDAYYIGRVVARAPGGKGINLDVENTRVMVREDYVNHRFLEWANEVLQRAEIAAQ